MGDMTVERKEYQAIYEIPVFEKEEGLALAEDILEEFNADKLCLQCSGCHGCR